MTQAQGAVDAVTALNSGLGLLFVMFGCMVGALHVSAVLSRRMIAAVSVRRDSPARCRQNQCVELDYLLRAICVPPGEHTVDLTYGAPLVKVGLAVSTSALLVIVALALVAQRRGGAR